MTAGRSRLHEAATLRDYLRTIGRRHRLVLAVVLAVLGLAVGASFLQQPEYEASAEVLLSRQNLAAALTGTQDSTLYQQPERLAETQARLARVPEVARRTIETARLTAVPVDEFLDSSSVEPQRNADLLLFTVRDADDETAARLATEYARQFILFRRELDTAALERARTEVEERITALEAVGDRSSALYASLVDKEQQLNTLEALQTSNASVVREADRAEQVQPQPVRIGLLSLALGVVLGIMAAFLRDALDTRVRGGEEIAARLGLPLLARIPRPNRRLRNEGGLVMVDTPTAVDAEAFRMLRTNIEFVNLDLGARTVMVTSAVQAEGKSTTVANLAVAFARAGRQVTLVDLDLRRPVLDEFFGLEGRPGLTDVALGRVTLDQALFQIGIDPTRGDGARRPGAGSLEVIASGPLPPDAGEFVGSRRLGAILEQLRERGDLVLIDAPPLLQVGDALALTARVDALLLVARLGVIRRGMVGELERILATVPTEKLGFVLTSAAGEEGYGYGYGYGYGHDAATARPVPREPDAASLA